ncbi:hypothetical protein MnTg02_01439 [bacterium MnTg02]|nr:hypothetical protein MnTg02_01439 [bacterium MnTg02]
MFEVKIQACRYCAFQISGPRLKTNMHGILLRGNNFGMVRSLSARRG